MKVDKHYIDISPVVSEKMAVFPGDVAYKRSLHMSVDDGDHIGLSSIECTVHLGAHADAPSHYGAKEKGIHEVGLEPYMGKAQVIHVKLDRGERILPKHIEDKEINASRVLFRTDSFPNPNEWNGDFNSLSPELLEYLFEKSVVLVGIDTPSVDPAESKALESHQVLLKRDIRVLEGIVLTEADEGFYQLIALPLSLKDADASPVRAILMSENEDLSQR